MSRMINRVRGRVYGWFDSKDARPMSKPLPAKFSTNARLALVDLEDRSVPATFTVDVATDAAGISAPTVGVGAGGIGDLRYCIAQANATPGADVIVFDATAFATPQVIALKSGLPATSSTSGEGLTITGPGADKAIITRDQSTPAFPRALQLAGSNTYVVEDLTFANFYGNSSGGVMYMASSPNVTINRCNVTGNTNTGSYGAVYMFTGGTLNVNDSSFTNNISAGSGAAIRLWTPTFTMKNSVLAYNTASQNSGTGGSAISIGSTSGGLTITTSTITGNVSLATNTAAGYGGAIGGTASGTITITGSIIAGNSAVNGRPDISRSPTTTTITNSLIGVADTFTFTNGGGNLTGTTAAPLNPQLQLVGLSGGKLPSIVPAAGSPAIDAYSGVAGFDVRGFARPATLTDMGAVERQAVEAPTYVFSNFGSPTPGSASYSFSVSYLGAIDTSTLGAGNIAVDGPVSSTVGYSGFTTFSGGVTANYTLTPFGGTWDSSTNGTFIPRVVANSVKDTAMTPVSAGPVGFFRQAAGTTFTVTNTGDDGGVNPAVGSGTGTLRQAIVDANDASKQGTFDTIVFDSSFNTAQTISLLASLPTISDGVTIIGPGSSKLTLNRGVATNFVMLTLTDTTGRSPMNISGLTIDARFGTSSSTSTAVVTSDEITTMNDVTITGVSTSSAGGGIRVGANAHGSLVLTNSTLTGMTAANGGGIHSYGGVTISVDRSTISNNSANGAGGGINFGTNSPTFGQSLSLTNSTVSGNKASTVTATDGGGGISFIGRINSNGFTVRNSTIANNTAVSSGGGLLIRTVSGGPVTIQNTTITANTSSTSSVTSGVGGGGLAITSLASAGVPVTVNLVSTILSGNSANATNGRTDLAAGVTGTNLVGLTTNANFSAIGVNAGFVLGGTSGNNLAFGAPLNLSGLAGNGGPTQTVALGAGSAALDTGSNPAALTTDQRGAGFARQQGSGVDIGAFEYDPNVASAGGSGFVNVTANQPGVNNPYTFTVTYSIAAPATITFSTINNNNSLVQITGPNGFNKFATFVSATPAADASSIAVSYKFDPGTNPGDPWVQALNGSYSAKVLGNIVQASNSAFVAQTVVGSFTVAIPATYVVNSDSDADDGLPTNGTTSLREAINLSNSDGTTSIINFDPTYFSTAKTVTMTGGVMNITSDVAINGPGANRFTIDGGAGQVFNANTGSGMTILIAGMEIMNASATNGGVFLNSTGNTVTFDGIYAHDNKATTNGSVFSSASAASNFTLRNSTISGNNAQRGALYFTSTAVINVINSTITGNTSSSVGGAIAGYSTGSGNLINISNSTITGNSALTGGAIRVTGSTAVVTLSSSILSGNTANNGPAAAYATINATDSVVSPTGSYVSGTFTGGLPQGTDFASLLLSPLAPYGGPMPTIVADPASPVANIGNNALSLPFDQRGTGFARVGSGKADIGATEIDGTIPAASGTFVNVTADQPGVNNPYTFTVTFKVDSPDTVTFSTINGNNSLIEVNGPNGFSKFGTFVSASPAANASTIVATYKFDPHTNPGDPWVAADNGTYTAKIAGGVVTASNGKTIAAGNIGSFSVGIPATYIVTTAVDNAGATANDGTLRGAILAANASTLTNDIIAFDSSFNTPQTIALVAALPAISESVTINAPTVGVTIDGVGTYRVLDVADAGTSVTTTLTLNRVTVANGKITTSLGAGIRISAGDALVLTDSTVRNNTNSGGAAAGIGFLANSANKLTVTRSTLSNNSASGGGGALDGGGSGGTFSFTDSTISNNTSSTGGAFGLAGGLALFVNVSGSTISGNSASGGGGAFRLYGGATTISNSTISGNTSGGAGGAFNFFQTYATTSLNIRNSTITGNKATTGGAINRVSTTTAFAAGNLVIESSIVAANTATSTTGPDMNFPTLVQAIQGNNDLIGVTDSGNFTLSGANHKTGTAATPLNPQLAALAGNGGLTFTHALLAGSAAIDNGTNIAPTLSNDQRGTGFLRTLNGTTDIGAFEYDPSVPSASAGGPFSNISVAGTFDPYTFTVTYAIAAPNTVTFSSINGNNSAIQVSGGTLGFNALATFVSATPAADSTSITATYKFDAPALPTTGWDGTDNGTYSVKVLANQIKSSNNAFVAATTVGTFTVNIPVTYVVNNNDDLDDGLPGNGQTSLREAMNLAELDAAASSIVFSTALGYFDGTPAKSVITLGSPLPTLSQPVSITGISTTNSIVDAAATGRVLNTTNGSPGAVFTISNLALTNGNAATGNGGGILVGDEDVTLINSSVSGNTATAGSGGAIYVGTAGKLTLTNTTVSTNVASGRGGAIHFVSANALTITGSTISNNSTAVSLGGGGGIFSSGASLTIDQSTISGNTHSGASYGGGGLYVTGGSLFQISNSTVTGNSSSGVFSTVEGGGGGIYIFTTPTVTNIFNTTISGNTAPWGGGFSAATTGTINFKNSTIANNSATNASGGGVYFSDASIVNIDSTVIGDNSAAGVANDFGTLNGPTLNVTYSAWSDTFVPNGTNTNNLPGLTTAQMKLDVLANNGGPTQTIALLPGSSLINAANPSQNQAFDQRGTGFNRVSGTAADIGAFEVQSAAPVANGFTVNDGNASRSRITTITVNFSGPVTASSFNTLGAITLTRTAVSNPATGVVGDIVQTGPAAANHITVTQGTATSLVLTFDNNGSFTTESDGVENGSLTDGYWKLEVGAFASTTGDLALRRLFGDSTNALNGTVDGSDFLDFGNFFNSNDFRYDYNNDGTISGADLLVFGNRFGRAL